PTLPLFPYTTLFRSIHGAGPAVGASPCSIPDRAVLPIPRLATLLRSVPAKNASAKHRYGCSGSQGPVFQPASAGLHRCAASPLKDRKSTRLNSSHLV